MSIIVSVKINDGIVLASDSATTFYSQDGNPGQIYEHVNKTVNLIKGLPIGVMTCGAGGIGDASIDTLLKDLRCRLSGYDKKNLGWRIDLDNYTIEGITSRMYDFFSEKIKESDFKHTFLLRICGYSTDNPLPEVWQVLFLNGICDKPEIIQSAQDFGARWNGENEVLDRIFLGRGSLFTKTIMDLGVESEKAIEADGKIIDQLYEHLILPAAPIQDAIDLARFMVETTKGFIRFAIKRAKTVGGQTEIATITKHEGFKWVQRKHFYPAALNLSEI